MPALRTNVFRSVQIPANPTRNQMERANDALANFHGYAWGIDSQGFHFFGPDGYIRVRPGDWLVVGPDRQLRVYSDAEYTALFV
jgi:hypothetical protein